MRPVACGWCPIARHRCRLRPVRGGLRQSDALFAHTRNLPELMRLLRADMEAGGWCPAAVGVSARPRDAADSYALLPCGRGGGGGVRRRGRRAAVPVLAPERAHHGGTVLLRKPALRSVGRELPDGDFLAFHVSGGTTEAVLAHPVPGGFSVEIVGYGADLHAGQVIDRVGVLLGLPFPLRSRAGGTGTDLHRAPAADPPLGARRRVQPFRL